MGLYNSKGFFDGEGGGVVRGWGMGVAYIRGNNKISNFNLAIFQLFL